VSSDEALLTTLGLLLSAGQSLNDVLGMTFKQAFLCAEAITLAKAKTLDSVLGPIVRQTGGEYKDTKMTGAQEPKGSLSRAQKKDIRRMHQLAALGIKVRDE
jgi:hypothetical protein